ncbi:MAG: hypothetical protein ACI9TF_001958 [Paracrocinitomix sp.]
MSTFAPGVLASIASGQAPSDFALGLPEVTSLRSYRGVVQPGEIFVATPVTTNWSLRIDGQPQDRLSVFGWAQVFVAEQPGTATLRHNNDQAMWFGAIAQLVAWLVLLTLLVLGRRRRT